MISLLGPEVSFKSQNVVHGQHDSKLGHKSDNEFEAESSLLVLTGSSISRLLAFQAVAIGVLIFCCSARSLIYP
jgi:hypothetical protein